MPRPLSRSPQLLLAGWGAVDEDQIDLVDAALTLSEWGNARLKTSPHHRHVENLVMAVKDYLGRDTLTTSPPTSPPLALAQEAVRQILVKRYGYAGVIDQTERANGADLATVITRRRGGALALCILYVHVFNAIDVPVEIVDFPAHPIIRVADAHAPLLIDPLNEGKIVDDNAKRALLTGAPNQTAKVAPGSPFALQTLSPRTILVRLQNEIKTHHLRQTHIEAATSALEGALLLAPKDSTLWREVGLLHARLDHFDAAIAALERYLALPGADQHRYTASQLLQHLQNRQDSSRS